MARAWQRAGARATTIHTASLKRRFRLLVGLDEPGAQGSDFIYRGIATRSFERRFALADHIQVKGADIKDGLLSIELVREIPESMKPKKIDIGGSRERSAIGGGEQKPASKQTVDAEAEHA